MSHVISYGSPEQPLVSAAKENFSGASFHRLSFCTTPVELLSNDGKDTVISHGTGFFWHHNGTDFVVTNWHVASGKNPFSGENLSDQGFIPSKIKFYGWKSSTIGNNIHLIRPSYTYDIGGYEKHISSPIFIDGRIYDVFAFPVPNDFAIFDENPEKTIEKFGIIEPRVNKQSLDKISTEAGDDCVLLGYPIRNYTGLNLPIWKRGSLATESNMAIDGSPAFLIDAATSSAMSGSPIFRRATGPVEFDKKTGTVTQLVGYSFIGIYAGRLKNKDLENINMGYGWFSSMIGKAIDESVKRITEICNEKISDINKCE